MSEKISVEGLQSIVLEGQISRLESQIETVSDELHRLVLARNLLDAQIRMAESKKNELIGTRNTYLQTIQSLAKRRRIEF